MLSTKGKALRHLDDDVTRTSDGTRTLGMVAQILNHLGFKFDFLRLEPGLKGPEDDSHRIPGVLNQLLRTGPPLSDISLGAVTYSRFLWSASYRGSCNCAALPYISRFE